MFSFIDRQTAAATVSADSPDEAVTLLKEHLTDLEDLRFEDVEEVSIIDAANPPAAESVATKSTIN